MENSGRKNGRPRKGEPPRVPYEELDQLLVFGEKVVCEDGESTTVVYPSYRDIAGRYNVSHSVIATYARKHNCLRRREQAQSRITAKAEQKLIEARATELALGKEDALRMIDGFLVEFEEALSEKRVRADNPTDFNTMIRLKEFLLGGADSRQEIHASLSLEQLQTRHAEMLRIRRVSNHEVRGELDATTASLSGPHEDEHPVSENPPASSTEAVAQKVSAGEPVEDSESVLPERTDEAVSCAEHAVEGA